MNPTNSYISTSLSGKILNARKIVSLENLLTLMADVNISLISKKYLSQFLNFDFFAKSIVIKIFGKYAKSLLYEYNFIIL